MKNRRPFTRSAVWCGASAGLVAFAACATPPSATYRDTYQETRTGGVRNTSHTNLVELGLQEQLGAGVEYRLADRFLRTEQTLENGNASTEQLRTLHQPSLDVSLAFGALTWLQGFETFRTSTDSSGSPDNVLQRTNILEKVEWTPVDLPQVTSWIDYRTDEDDFITDREDTEFVLEVEDAVGPASYLYSFEAEEIEDAKSDVRDDRTEHTLRSTYRDDYFNGMLSGRANVLFEHRTSTSRVPVAGASEVQVGLQMGYGAVDTTPEISILPEIPALTDGIKDAPTGINIGGFASGGETNWNVGARLPVSSSGNVIYLYTTEEVDQFLLNQFAFSVWQSDDNNFWSLVSGSAAFTYDRTLLRFRVVFPLVEARYLKIVNSASPPTAPAVLVTEIEVAGPGAGGGGGSRSRDDVSSIRSLTGGLSYRPTDDLILNYDVFLQSTERESAGTVTRDETRIDNTLSMIWTPTTTVDVNLRAGVQDVRDDVAQNQLIELWSGLVDWKPLDTLDVALTHTGSKRMEGGGTAFETSGTQARTSAQLLDTLSSDLLFERSVQQDHRNQREIERFAVSAAMIAALTRSLDLTLSYRNEDATVSGPGAGGIPDPSERETEVLILYRPSEQLTSEVRLEWKRSFVGSGLDRRFRVDWVPFRNGTIDLQLDVDHTESGTIEASALDRYVMISRWNMNPKAYFQMDYSAQIPEHGLNAQTFTVSFNLTM